MSRFPSVRGLVIGVHRPEERQNHRLVLRILGHGERDQEMVNRSWQQACVYLPDAAVKLVLLDEINVALKLGYMSLETVLAGLEQRPPLTHVALTGRGASPGLIAAADLVTDMTMVRHPFREQG
ncbi:hypothetical protein BO91_00945 [Candidatus Synechococcus spongiarum LMB bulk10E]|nr:hypothetical protein BO91_00945 [Candidatus Synechococcus spongiarum LMB bulk10E]